jgi:hypothetical protein
MPALKNLPLSAHNFLKKIGMLWEFYPEATGEWSEDCEKPIPISIKELNKLIDEK